MIDLLVYIPTLGRENTQITLQWIPDRWKDRVFLVCPKSENHIWENRVDVPNECIGDIGKTRQFIIENSPSKFVGMMDDDLTMYYRDPVDKVKRTKIEFIGEYLDMMESWLNEGDVYCSQSNTFMSHTRDEEYYYGKPSHTHFLNRDYLAEHNIRFDDIKYFEDFHIPLSILQSGSRLRISGNYVAAEKEANAAGGCSINRTAANNKEAMLQLRKLHPKYIKLKAVDGAKNQNLDVGLRMTISWKKTYMDNVVNRGKGIDAILCG